MQVRIQFVFVKFVLDLLFMKVARHNAKSPQTIQVTEMMTFINISFELKREITDGGEIGCRQGVPEWRQ